MYYVLNDNRAKAREAFVAAENEIDDLYHNYSGYYAVDYFDSKKEAEQFCESFNLYEGEPDVELWCCSRGCKMTAYDYAHRGDGCVYEGRDFDAEEAEHKEYLNYYHKVEDGEITLDGVPDYFRNDIKNAIEINRANRLNHPVQSVRVRRERTPRRN